MRYSILSLFVFIFHYPGWSQNYIGSGVTLNYPGGNGDYVNLGDVYNGIDFPFTVEAWLYPASTPSFNPVFNADGNTSNYTGFEVRIDYGNIFFSMGDGSGNGPGDRRGAYSSSEIIPDRWTHIACVASNASTWEIYINGVKDVTVPSGTSSATSLVWSSSSAYIGRYNDYWQNSFWNGQMDEVRLWNTARTQTEIRDFMCRKIDPSSTGLIGYWVGDESYTSSILNDQTSPSENGTLNGSVTRITSGAPVGNESAYVYTSSWNGISISVNQASGDSFIASDISGNPFGVQVYRVDSLPYDTIGLNTTPEFYFGVFCAPASNVPGYKAIYEYDFSNNIINSNNESTATLFKRNDGSVTTWSNSLALLDMVNDFLEKNNETIRGEYILDVINLGSANFIGGDNSVCEKFCVDFFDQSTNNPLSWEWIFEGGSPASSVLQNPGNICYNVPGTYDVTLITEASGGFDTITLYDYIIVYPTPPFPIITQHADTLFSSPASFYQWLLDAVEIPGATNQFYVASVSGAYTVLVTDSNGCQNSTTVKAVISAIEEIEPMVYVSLFPNPATDMLNVDFSGSSDEIRSVTILDGAGKVLKKFDSVRGGRLTIDIADLLPGVYLIIVNSSSEKFHGKFQVQR